jgi:hypothetical protein
MAASRRGPMDHQGHNRRRGIRGLRAEGAHRIRGHPDGTTGHFIPRLPRPRGGLQEEKEDPPDHLKESDRTRTLTTARGSVKISFLVLGAETLCLILAGFQVLGTLCF